MSVHSIRRPSVPALVMDVVVELLALPLAVLLAPLFAIGNAADELQARARARKVRREADLTLEQIKLEGRRANAAFQADLEAVGQLRATFLRSVRTPAEARIAWELLRFHQDEFLRRRRGKPSS